MNILIVGGGRLAYYLISSLLSSDHDLTLIETERGVGQKIATKFEQVRVFHGDGTDIRVLEEAGCKEADYFIAVTGTDENNLIGCQVAKRHFKVRKTVARVNNPKNLDMFRLLGVDLIYSSTSLVVDLIEQDIDYDGMKVVFNIKDTAENIVEIRISPESDAVGQMLMHYAFPGKARVVLITTKAGKAEIPRGTSVIEADDRLLVICNDSEYDEIYRRMVERKGKGK